VLFFWRSLLTGVEASAAQNSSVTKTCSQCGAVLSSNVRACNFCDSALSLEQSSTEAPPAFAHAASVAASSGLSSRANSRGQQYPQAETWAGPSRQTDSYRSRYPKDSDSSVQSQLPFAESNHVESCQLIPVQQSVRTAEDFSFTIAIGRYSPPPERRDGRMLIDVSLPAGPSELEDDSTTAEPTAKHYGLYSVAPISERRFAALLDIFFLSFAYGGFLALFGSLGGQFTLSKLSAAVYVATFAIVYLQYFALFTIFGGTTPGMMFRGLQVTSFSGETPTPRQMLMRALGYLISAGTLFMGFLWSCWDEDTLTWHDRLSRTYLTSPETHVHMKHVAHDE
jgi:uncharacterized RDD family membrane protein YckC